MGGMLATLRATPHSTRRLLIAQYLSSLPVGLLMVLFPLYLHDLGVRAFLIGGIFTLAGLGASLLLMAIGPLADRFGRRAFLLGGMALPALGFLIFVLTTQTGWLVVASMFGGVGFAGGLGGGLVTATFNPILAGTVPPRMRTMMMSWSEIAWTCAIGSGAFLAGLPTVLDHAHLMRTLDADRLLFLFCLVLSLSATLVLLPVREHHHLPEPVRASTVEAGPPMRTPYATILKLSLFFALQGAGLGLVVQLLPLWFELRFHTTAEAIAPWFAAAQLAGMPMILFVPRLARRFGVGGLIVLVASLSTLLLCGVPLAPVLPVAGLFFVIRSSLVAMQWPAQQSFLMGAVEPRVRGTAMSVALGCWSITNALSPSLSGYLLDRRLLMLPLVVGISCYGCATLWFWLTLRHTAMPEEREGAGTEAA